MQCAKVNGLLRAGGELPRLLVSQVDRFELQRQQRQLFNAARASVGVATAEFVKPAIDGITTTAAPFHHLADGPYIPFLVLLAGMLFATLLYWAMCRPPTWGLRGGLRFVNPLTALLAIACHADLPHLLNNSFYLMYHAPIAAAGLGCSVYLGVALMAWCAVCSSFLSSVARSSQSVSVGASGVIMGISCAAMVLRVVLPAVHAAEIRESSFGNVWQQIGSISHSLGLSQKPDDSLTLVSGEIGDAAFAGLQQVAAFLAIDAVSGQLHRRGVDIFAHIGGGIGGTAFAIAYIYARANKLIS